MSRRKHSGEVNIGSDSFLDVIANIVGILIILIVIAGVRVSRAPVIKKKSAPVSNIVEPPAKTQPDESPPELAPPLVAAIPVPKEPEPEEPIEPQFVEQTERPVEIARRIQSMQSEIETLESAAARRESERRELEQQQASGELQISAGHENLVKVTSEYETRSRGAEELQSLIDSQKNNLKLLQSQLDELAHRAPKTKTIKHRVTPISRVVVGEQLHFRISGNKVSQVPIHELLQSAMRQAKRHAESLSATRSQMGTVGPTGGYLLQYKLEVVPASTAEIARHGPGMVRIALSSFQLQPDTELREETTSEALARGSMFDIAMQTAEPGSTFTLWVYPDSFPTYRQLQSKLHEAGFTVAGRPLPHGIPIAGSPDGSASAGQ